MVLLLDRLLEVVGLLAEGVVALEGRLPLGALLVGLPPALGLLLLEGFPLGLALFVGLGLAVGLPLLEGGVETGLFSAKTGSLTVGFS